MRSKLLREIAKRAKACTACENVIARGEREHNAEMIEFGVRCEHNHDEKARTLAQKYIDRNIERVLGMYNKTPDEIAVHVDLDGLIEDTQREAMGKIMAVYNGEREDGLWWTVSENWFKDMLY